MSLRRRLDTRRARRARLADVIVPVVVALLCVAFACVQPAIAASAFPSDSGIVNVRDHGAKGDGTTDDTQAIRDAIAAARVDQGKFFWPARIVYFPAGTYRVTDTLAKRDAQGRYLASMALVGESIDRVRLRLDDGAPGFGDAKQPKAVIYTSSTLLGGAPGAGGKDYLGKGEGNDAYGNFVESLTVEVGRNNPGAIGIDFLASNSGAIRHVRVAAPSGSGRIGISMDRRWPGPLLLSDVRVDGFGVGISVSQREYGVTMEDVSLSGQTEVALRNNGNMLALRRVSVDSAAIGVQNLAPDGLIVADGLALRLTRGEANWADNRGYMTIKGTRLTSAVPDAAGDRGRRANTLAAAADGAYFGNLRLAEFDAGWRLDAPAAPPEVAAATERWASVVRYGAKTDTEQDATEAIQAAMQSGAEVVYFPAGRYTISAPIVVPATVRRIAGMFSSISVSRQRAAGFKSETGMFRVASGGDPLTIERVALDNMGRQSQLGVEHIGARTLVLRDVLSAGTGLVQRGATGGVLFLENVCCGATVVAGHSAVWARQLNTEGQGVRILNDGAPMSILGLKTEQNCTAIENRAGAETEVLGGLLYIIQPTTSPRPAFVNPPAARLVASYVETVYREGANYRVHVATGSSDAASAAPLPGSVLADELPARGRGRLVPGLVMQVKAPAQ